MLGFLLTDFCYHKLVCTDALSWLESSFSQQTRTPAGSQTLCPSSAMKAGVTQVSHLEIVIPFRLFSASWPVVDHSVNHHLQMRGAGCSILGYKAKHWGGGAWQRFSSRSLTMPVTDFFFFYPSYSTRKGLNASPWSHDRFLQHRTNIVSDIWASSCGNLNLILLLFYQSNPKPYGFCARTRSLS